MCIRDRENRDKRLDIRDKSIENRESESARAYGRYQNVFLTDEEDVYKRQTHNELINRCSAYQDMWAAFEQSDQWKMGGVDA